MVVKRYAKTPDFDSKLRPYTKSFYGSQKVCKKTPDFDANWNNLLMNVVMIFKYGI